MGHDRNIVLKTNSLDGQHTKCNRNRNSQQPGRQDTATRMLKTFFFNHRLSQIQPLDIKCFAATVVGGTNLSPIVANVVVLSRFTTKLTTDQTSNVPPMAIVNMTSEPAVRAQIDAPDSRDHYPGQQS